LNQPRRGSGGVGRRREVTRTGEAAYSDAPL
jgi:hypothetical protein